MKPTMSTQLGQQLHLTPQLLQSIRLLQLDGMQLELEIRRALETNPLLEIEEAPEAPAADTSDTTTVQEVAAFDELPESAMWMCPAPAGRTATMTACSGLPPTNPATRTCAPCSA